MDLTTSFPRSPKDKFAGVMMAARTADKAKAKLDDKLGEYHYNCPLDQGLFSFLGIDHEKFLETVKNAKSDADIEAYTKTFADKQTPEAIAAYNDKTSKAKPEAGSDGEKYFLGVRSQLAPDRTDITTWVDLLDLEEKRNVPKRDPALA